MSGEREGKTSAHAAAGAPAPPRSPSSVGKSPLTAGMVGPSGGAAANEEPRESGAPAAPPDLDPHDELIDLLGVRHLVPLPTVEDAADGASSPRVVQRQEEASRAQVAISTDQAQEVGDVGVHEAAERGLAEPAVVLPHLTRIQASFGHHDVSGVQAHVGGAAAEASATMGATAYATGDHVAFASAPNLHTAAHEAAHTVQQRGGVQLRGGVGDEGDDYERHADAVADRVVRGESAEELLGGSAASGVARPALQHKKKAGGDTSDDKDGDEPELVKQDGADWPVFAKSGRPYMIEDRGGKPGFWAARAWITAASDVAKATDKRTKRTAYLAPSRAREVLGAMGWMAPEKIEFAASQLTFEFHGELSHFIVGAQAAFATGLPQGRQAVVDRDGDGGLLVTLALDDQDLPPGSQHQPSTSEVTRAFRAAASFTGLDIDPDGQAFLMGIGAGVGMVGNGVVSLTLDRTACRTLFGMEAYDTWVGEKKKKKAEEPKTPKLKLENFYKRPIPGRLTHYGDVVESGEALRLEVLVDWPPGSPDFDVFDAPPMVTPSKFGNVALMSCTWRFERIDGAAAQSPKETQSTTVAEATHRFRLAKGEATGTFRATCDARFDEYFTPATFSRDIVVMSSAAAMEELKSEAFAGLGAPGIYRQQGKWTGDLQRGFKPSPLAGSGGDVDDPMARERAGQRDRLQSVADYLRANPASEEAVAALDQELVRQKQSEKLLAADRAKGWQTFQIRGTYLSRTEGLASGPLDLHGTVHVEEHYDTWVDADAPGSSMTERNDRTVVRIRDLSRRFEQSDFVFEAEASTFDEALRQAFNDLAVAYPKGLVSIEAEQINNGALKSPEGVAGPGAAYGPGTGKVIGFQRSTETTWKKVKEVVWDPVASIAVNLGAIALMTLVPGSAAVVAPALVAYNSIPSADRIKTEADRGTLTLGTVAMSTGEIALNLLPLVARAKPFTAGWYAVETANWGGQVALMGASAVDMARQLQATQVAALAEEYQQFLELQKNSLPSDPGLAIAEEAIRRKAVALDDEISRQFWAQVKGNVFQMAAGSVIHNTSTHVRTAILNHLGGAGVSWKVQGEQFSERAIAQIDDKACGPACVDMALEDRGIPRPPQDMIARSARGGDVVRGTRGYDLARVLNQLDPAGKWVDDVIDGPKDPNFPQWREIAMERTAKGSWIALVWDLPIEGHWVVVEHIAPDGMVSIRDPWPYLPKDAATRGSTGTVYQVKWHEFSKAWKTRVAVFSEANAMTWSRDTEAHKEPFVVLLHGVRAVSPDAFEIDVEWSFQEQWGMPAAKARGWYRINCRPMPGFPDFRSLRADLPERLGLGQGALVRVAGIAQRQLEAGEAVAFPIDIAHGDLEQFFGEES